LVYFKGALTGFITSLAFALWMSFGQPRPVTRKLFVSIDKCSSSNLSSYEGESFSWNKTTTEASTTLITSNQDLINTNIGDEEYFYLYRISYTWYAFIGFTLTVAIGTFTSSLYNRFYYSYAKRKRTVDEHEEQLDADLFITPIRNRLLEKQGLTKNQKEGSSCNGKIDNEHISFHELKIHE
jgi:sodium-coupled monocarboxylate transporter 8/12